MSIFSKLKSMWQDSGKHEHEECCDHEHESTVVTAEVKREGSGACCATGEECACGNGKCCEVKN